jgi:hypothetical protein
MNLVRRMPLWSRITLAIVSVAVLVLAFLVASALAWADEHSDRERFLVGTTVSGVDIGEMVLAEARGKVTVALEERLERTITLEFEDRSWETTPAQLDVAADVDEALDRALRRVSDASIVDLLRWRWLGAIPAAHVPVLFEVPDDEIRATVANLAGEIDRAAESAELTWEDGELGVREAVTGLDLDHEAAEAAIRQAIGEDEGAVALPVERTDPEVATATLASSLDPMREAVSSALERDVVLAFEDREWRFAPRDLDAAPDLSQLLEGAIEAAGEMTPSDVPVDLRIEDEAVDAALAAIAEELEVPARNAGIEHDDGWIQLVEPETGLAIDRDDARAQLVRGLAGEDVGTVQITRGTSQPEVGLDRYRHVLLVRHDLRRLYLYVDGEIHREWPVAVGAGGSPTPTGVFQVGAKRSMPTWVNPAPNGWGADMPASVAPGPGNPLGLRALNWNRNGADTLIRFHGTPQEHTIGQAASRGCVRMRNNDVVELFDLVPSGATIVSLTSGTPTPPAPTADHDAGDSDEDTGTVTVGT